MQKILSKTIRYAGAHTYDANLRFRLCAILMRGGNILSIGYNDTSINSFVRYCACTKSGIVYSNLHAEMDAVLQARRKSDLRGCKIYVARVLKDGNPAMARPCSLCQTMLSKYGVKKAYYTISKNEYGVLKI